MQAVVTNGFTKPTVTMYQVLRCHSLNQLADKDDADLKTYLKLLTDRISTIETKLKTQNVLFSQIGELTNDLRWFSGVKEDITTILTARFYSKKPV